MGGSRFQHFWKNGKTQLAVGHPKKKKTIIGEARHDNTVTRSLQRVLIIKGKRFSFFKKTNALFFLLFFFLAPSAQQVLQLQLNTSLHNTGDCEKTQIAKASSVFAHKRNMLEVAIRHGNRKLAAARLYSTQRTRQKCAVAIFRKIAGHSELNSPATFRCLCAKAVPSLSGKCLKGNTRTPDMS
ncbi:hypothetical protein TRVL_08659 [Trypanosoma vivax]|nr:hypothetical protein TRVL_08659 [Trypanosoma vivax]